MARPLALLVGLLLAIAAGPAAQARDWTSVSGDGKFTVLMPGPAKETVREIDADGGREVVHTYTADDGDSAIYAISFSDMPGAPKQPLFLKQAQDRAVTAAQGTARNSKEIALGRWPGREFVAETAKGLVYTSRIYLVGSRFYQLAVYSTKSGASTKAIGKFLDSFKLIRD